MYLIDCVTCTDAGAYTAYSTSSKVIGRYYKVGTDVYRLDSVATGPTYDVDISSAPSATNCSTACL